MSVRAGREFLMIPGPTTMPDEVLRAMHRPAVEIYSGSLVELTDTLLRDMSRVFRTAGRSYLYAANGHGAWEAALTNVLSRGDKVLVLDSGRFAREWGNAAAALGCEALILEGDWRRAVRPAEVEARLRADKNGEITAVLAVQIDTASGVANDIGAIGAAIKAARHNALFMVDAVASLGCVPLEMDEWGIDVAMAGSQKGMMTPPGLAFVAASPRARAAHDKANLRTPYWDWAPRESKEHYPKWGGTPPEHLMFALRQSLDMMLAEGLDNVVRRHRLLAETVRRAITRWGEGDAMQFNVLEPSERSDTVTVVLMEGASALVEFCNKVCGVAMGRTIGELQGKGFRIAHMGHINAPMILGALGAIEVGLCALHKPHGKGGLDAAATWLGDQLAT
jgi:alanine-glyoxylate transaminase/serine-glyoxylate transaminase/serine-pyruvate transaminase